MYDGEIKSSCAVHAELRNDMVDLWCKTNAKLTDGGVGLCVKLYFGICDEVELVNKCFVDRINKLQATL